MTKLLEKLKNSRSGASLAETLLVILLLALMGSAVTGGISAALNAHKKALRKENAEILSTTVLSTIKGELEGAEYIGESAIVSDGSNRAVSVFLCHSGRKLDGLQAGFWTNQKGRLMVSYIALQGGSLQEIQKAGNGEEDSFGPRLMLTESTYPNGLYCRVEQELDSANTHLTIRVRIYYKDSSDTEKEITDSDNPPSVTVTLV